MKPAGPLWGRAPSAARGTPRASPRVCAGRQLLGRASRVPTPGAGPLNTCAPPPLLANPPRVGVVSGLRQLLEFGLFHGDPHPGNIFCLRDGRIAYVDFGNVAQLSNSNKQVRALCSVRALFARAGCLT